MVRVADTLQKEQTDAHGCWENKRPGRDGQQIKSLLSKENPTQGVTHTPTYAPTHAQTHEQECVFCKIGPWKQTFLANMDDRSIVIYFLLTLYHHKENWYK